MLEKLTKPPQRNSRLSASGSKQLRDSWDNGGAGKPRVPSPGVRNIVRAKVVRRIEARVLRNCTALANNRRIKVDGRDACRSL